MGGSVPHQGHGGFVQQRPDRQRRVRTLPVVRTGHPGNRRLHARRAGRCHHACKLSTHVEGLHGCTQKQRFAAHVQRSLPALSPPHQAALASGAALDLLSSGQDEPARWFRAGGGTGLGTARPGSGSGHWRSCSGRARARLLQGGTRRGRFAGVPGLAGQRKDELAAFRTSVATPRPHGLLEEAEGRAWQEERWGAGSTGGALGVFSPPVIHCIFTTWMRPTVGCAACLPPGGHTFRTGPGRELAAIDRATPRGCTQGDGILNPTCRWQVEPLSEAAVTRDELRCGSVMPY
eukprot:scaffold2843_cov465-Pavlova_lutheri.AAC.1